MAVEANNINHFPQSIANNNRYNFMSSNQMNQANVYAYNNTQIGSVANFAIAMADNISPFNQSLLYEAKNSIKADSGITCNLPKKRSRDLMEQYNTSLLPVQKNNNPIEFASPSFLGEDISLQIQQHQLEIDQIIAHHNKKIRMEIEDRQKQHTRLLLSTMNEGVMKKLNEKDEQIQRMTKINLALHEKIKSLCVENQLWRDLAQTNEAAAINLQSNLEQVLAHVSEERISGGVADEAESCCGSNEINGEEEVEVAGKRTLADVSDRMCRKCGEKEACVLLMPCRHLCVCNICGSQLLESCPVCYSRITGTVHVNLS